jgi:hypothetical protein
MRRATKDDIIHVNLNKQKAIAMFKSKAGLIYTPQHIPMLYVTSWFSERNKTQGFN